MSREENTPTNTLNSPNAHSPSNAQSHRNTGLKEFFSEQTEVIHSRFAESTKQLLDFQTGHQLCAPVEQRMFLLN